MTDYKNTINLYNRLCRKYKITNRLTLNKIFIYLHRASILELKDIAVRADNRTYVYYLKLEVIIPKHFLRSEKIYIVEFVRDNQNKEWFLIPNFEIVPKCIQHKLHTHLQKILFWHESIYKDLNFIINK